MKKYFLYAVMIAAFITTPNTNAQVSDESAILDLIENWAALENDLEAQASLVRDDRVQIGGGIRQTDQAKNLEVQIMRYDALVESWGGEPQMIVRIEDPLIRVYGDAAVASFLRLFDVAPPGKPANATGRAWFSMFLVKENDEWKIAHHHVSSAN